MEPTRTVCFCLLVDELALSQAAVFIEDAFKVYNLPIVFLVNLY